MDMASRYDDFGLLNTEELLKAFSQRGHVESSQGLNELKFIQSLLLVRIVEPLTAALHGGTETMGKSANLISEKLDSLAQGVDASRKDVQSVGQRIGSEIGNLINALEHASADLKAAGLQSSKAAARLNWLTLVLAFATIAMAVGTIFQVRIGNRQAELMQRQIQIAEQQLSKSISSAAPSATQK